MKRQIMNPAVTVSVVLLGALTMPMHASATIPVEVGAATGAVTQQSTDISNVVSPSSAVMSEEFRPLELANGCWIYVGGEWIYICHQQEKTPEKS